MSVELVLATPLLLLLLLVAVQAGVWWHATHIADTVAAHALAAARVQERQPHGRAADRRAGLGPAGHRRSAAGPHRGHPDRRRHPGRGPWPGRTRRPRPGAAGSGDRGRHHRATTMTRPPRLSMLPVRPNQDHRPVDDIRRGAAGGREEGSVSVELVLLTPLFLLVIALLVLCGRVMDVRLQAASLAHQTARAASTQPDPRRAQAAADSILAQPGLRCPTERGRGHQPMGTGGHRHGHRDLHTRPGHPDPVADPGCGADHRVVHLPDRPLRRSPPMSTPPAPTRRPGRGAASRAGSRCSASVVRRVGSAPSC